MGQVTLKLEFSRDPLSDTTPTWIDITQWVMSAEWQTGGQRDFDQPQAGTAAFILRNDFQSGANRRFEPQYASGAYYPDIVPLRRFRLTITADGTARQQGIWYATSWQPSYPGQTALSIVTVTCTDGLGVLSLDPCGPLDPPDAASYPDVVAFDKPYAYYRLGEQHGTKMAAETGQDGSYKSYPTGGVAGRQGSPLVIGDAATSIAFSGARGAQAQLISQNNFADTNELAVEFLFHPTTASGSVTLASGPFNSSSLGPPPFEVIWQQSTGSIHFSVSYGTGSTQFFDLGTANGAIVVGTVYHVVCRWDGTNATIWINGAQVASANHAGRQVLIGDPNGSLYVGNDPGFGNSASAGFDLQEVAFYEYALPDDRITAHYQAARQRGYVQQSAGARVAAIAANPLWSTSGIDTSAGLTVVPRMKASQSKLDEIVTTSQAEAPDGLFFFDGAGNPQYRTWDDPSEGAITNTLGDDAAGTETRYSDLDLVYDDEMYNLAQVTRDGGTIQQAEDTASEAAYGTRAYTDSGRILALDSDAATVAQSIVDSFGDPLFRVDTVTLNGATLHSRTQLLTRQIGDMIRLKRRGEGGIAIDINVRILGMHLLVDSDQNLWGDWSLSRGFTSAPTSGAWQLGVAGHTELGSTAVLN